MYGTARTRAHAARPDRQGKGLTEVMIDPRPVLTIGYSPDPDDAFMWWPLVASGDEPAAIDTGRFRFEAVVADIETLNRRSEAAELEITAMSCAQYAAVMGRYAVTACGASLGDGYGPRIVARSPMVPEELRDVAAGPGTPDTVAVPGVRTTAFAVMSLMLGPGSFRHVEVPFDEIIARVADGTHRAGLVIHEGQLTFEAAGLHLVADLGAWWKRRHDLPIPLGINTIRRDLEDAHGPGTLAEVTRTLRRSIEHALAHRAESIDRALAFARHMGADEVDRFVGLYVNDRTIDLGDAGRAAVRVLLGEMRGAGLVGRPVVVDVVDPAPVEGVPREDR